MVSHTTFTNPRGKVHSRSEATALKHSELLRKFSEAFETEKTRAGCSMYRGFFCTRTHYEITLKDLLAPHSKKLLQWIEFSEAAAQRCSLEKVF